MLVITLAIAIEFEQAGILLSLFATYVRVLVTIFHCHPILRAAHLSVVCLLFTSVILLHFGRGGKRDTSAAPILPFVGIAVYAVAPLAHWATVSESTSVSSTTFAWLLLPYLQVTLQVPTIWFIYIYIYHVQRVGLVWPSTRLACQRNSCPLALSTFGAPLTNFGMGSSFQVTPAQTTDTC